MESRYTDQSYQKSLIFDAKKQSLYGFRKAVRSKASGPQNEVLLELTQRLPKENLGD